VDAQGLHRNDILMSPEVEDLQIEVGLDVNNDGLIDTSDTSVEFPLDTSDGLDAQRIRTLRLTVITRTDQVDVTCGTACSGRQAAGDRVAGAADGRRRRRFVATVAPRNMR
jgi:hypothetical protein